MQIRLHDGNQSNAVDLDIDLSTLTAQETERVESVTTEAERAARSTKLLRAIIWAKLLWTPYSGFGFDDIDFDLSDLAAFAETPDEKQWVQDAEMEDTLADVSTIGNEVSWEAS